ncbi:IS21-like element helper ATPase IstB [Desulfoluna sp.]|uniref:IS21-like element helper ATPase IstB n=1 Tax=Desulfoluna sp. TaxID=2045199 RepID=UPI002634B6A8|nr:IS21-like element helper ATPase IstB [Desulfoluna sp.]
MNTAAMHAILIENLKQLKLSSMTKNIESELRQARENGISYEEFLLNLSELEIHHRRENGRKRRVKEAMFPLFKPLETFDFTASPQLDRRLVRELATGEYLKEKRNIIFMGKSGTGKTHLATALGIEACTEGHRTRFVTGCGLANELIEAGDKKGLTRMLKRYAGYGLLVVDELGYVPFSKEGGELLFQVLAERHEKRSVIITTNLGFGDWTQVFGDPNLTAALLDRLTHKAHVIHCNWDSYRLKETLKGQARVTHGTNSL